MTRPAPDSRWMRMLTLTSPASCRADSVFSSQVSPIQETK
jgi:hypothetical protein